MSDALRILLIIFSLVWTIIILHFLRKNKLPIKYSLFWLTAVFIIFLVGAFPNFVGFFTSFIGFETTSNLVIGIMIGLLLMITLILTIIISEQNKRIKLLIQQFSMLKSEYEKRHDDEK